MNDERSTNDIRMIAQEVVVQQERLCAARREGLEKMLEALATTVGHNAEAIAKLTTTVATTAVTLTPLAAKVQAHGSAIEKLKGRPAVWAAIGAALPTLLGVLLWWFSK